MVSDLIVLDPAMTPAQHSELADVPPEHEWLANLPNDQTKRAYKADVGDFSRFAGLKSPAALSCRPFPANTRTELPSFQWPSKTDRLCIIPEER
jgi:hypothetical protein